MSLAQPLPLIQERKYIPAIQDRKYIPALDGLRGLAVLLVITFHYSGYTIFSMGWAGVDLFFVLSGYLITGRLVANENNKNRYGIFYKNRALRILPLYYLLLAIYYFAIFFIVSPKNFHRFDFYIDNWPGFVFFLQNWSYIFSGPAIENHLGPVWSLAVEEQFYLFWPFVVYRFYKSRYFISILWASVCAVLLLRCSLYIFNGPPVPIYAYYDNTFCRLDGLIIGAITFFLLHCRPAKNSSILILAAISLIGLITGIAITQTASHLSVFMGTLGYTAVAFIFAGVVYLVITKPGSYIDRFFKNGFLLQTGKISYGLYIVHIPIWETLVNKLNRYFRDHYNINSDVAMLFTQLFCIVLSYGLALLSFYYFERYFLQKKHKPLPA